MTFTYGENLSDDRDFVRFKAGDTTADESYLSDELIASLLATTASKEAATLDAVRYILTQLSKPDIKADWLEVKLTTARQGYEKLLARLEAEFGPDGSDSDGGLGGSSVKTYRADSAAIRAPDFTDGRASVGYAAEAL